MNIIKIFFLLFFVKNNASVKQKMYAWRKISKRYKKIIIIPFLYTVYKIWNIKSNKIYEDPMYYKNYNKIEIQEKLKEFSPEERELYKKMFEEFKVPIDGYFNFKTWSVFIKSLIIPYFLVFILYVIIIDISILKLDVIYSYFYNQSMLNKISQTKYNAETEISKNYLSKNNAIRIIVEKIKNANETNGISSCYVFNGVTGTGKTLLANNIQKYLDDKNYNIINGTEFAKYDAANTEKLHYKLMQDNTIKVILIDEFDKMAKEYQTLFLELLSNKKINITTEDKLYITINLDKCMFIFNMNAGQNVLYNKNLTHEEKIEALQDEFDEKYGTYFTSRVNEIFIFDQIDSKNINEEELQTIFIDYIIKMKKEHNIDIIFDKSIFEHYKEKFGIRKLITTVVDKIENHMNNNYKNYTNCTIKITSENNKFKFEIVK